MRCSNHWLPRTCMLKTTVIVMPAMPARVTGAVISTSTWSASNLPEWGRLHDIAPCTLHLAT